MKLSKPTKFTRQYFGTFYFDVPNSEYFFAFEHFDNCYVIWEWVKPPNMGKRLTSAGYTNYGKKHLFQILFPQNSPPRP